MKRSFTKYRSFLVRGTIVIATTLLLLCVTGWHDNKSTGSEVTQPPNNSVTTTKTIITTTARANCTTTISVSSSTISSISTALLTTTTAITEMTETATTTTTPYTEPTTVVTIEPTTEETLKTELPITEQEFILISNVISHEAGCLWTSEYERVCIVAAIMNRVNDARFPNTIDAVLHQPYQFFNVPYYRVDYSGIGYTPIDNAIYAYFNGKYNCGNINSWSSNGRNNYFYYR